MNRIQGLFNCGSKGRIKEIKMQKSNEKFLFYAVTGNDTSLNSIEQACLGGISVLQLREKNLSPKAFVTKARQVLKITKQHNIPLIINDQLSVFEEVGADGLHLGQDDISIKIAREKIGPNKILGASVTSVKEAIKAQEQGADYLGVGAVFPSSTKQDAKIVSIDTLKEIVKYTKIPVVAIGGLTCENIKLLTNTKIAGLAFSSAVFNGNIQKNCKKMRTEIKNLYQV